MRILSLAILLAVVLSVSSYKILVYSNLFGHSHVKMLGTIADTITDAGHNVTVLMPIIDVKERSKIGLKTTKNLITVEPDEIVLKKFEVVKDFLSNLWVMDDASPMVMMSYLGEMGDLFSGQCKKVLSDTKLLDKLRAEKFDLGVAEPFDFCGYELFDAINIRAHVSVLSAARFDHVSAAIGQPSAPSYVPASQSSYNDRMSMTERLINFVSIYAGAYLFASTGDLEDKVARDLFPNARSWRDVLPESTFVFTNQLTLLDFPSPTLDKIIPIGGISVKPAKNLKLPEKWDKVLSLRKTNVFISFGSNAKSVQMPNQYKNGILEMAQMMPDTTFIWKYEDEKDTFASHVKNIHLGSWLPQNELLADKRLNLFITHGGLGSVTELSLMGKPCVMIPLFADQERNAQVVKRHGGAAVLNKADLANPKLLKETIEEVLNNEIYQKRAERVAELLNNQPTDPKETLIKHIEFAARFGKLPSMDPYGRHQTFIEYFLIDIISLILFTLITILFIIYKLVKFICCCCGKSTTTQENKKKSE